MPKVMMKGNEALGEAAVRAGVRMYCGYPITPQTEIMEYLSWRLPEVGGVFLQSESEVAGASMALGAGTTGYRVITCSSSTGYSLKQEAISWMAGNEIPCMVVDVCRYGCALGLLSGGQDSYFQTTKGGGHGDYHAIVYGPSTIQEMVDLVALAYDRAEKYRTPVIMLSDGSLGQMMEPVEFPDFIEPNNNKDWAIRGKGEGKGKKIQSRIIIDPDHDAYIQKKYAVMEENEQMWEDVQTEDAEVILVSFGTSARVCKQAVATAREQGIKLGLIRPITLWPFPKKAFEKIGDQVKGFMSVEMSILGQMVEDVALCVNGRRHVYLYPAGHNPAEEDIIIEMAKQILDGTLKEVY